MTSNNYIEKLEFISIKKNLSELCSFYISKKLALNITPSFSKEEVYEMQNLTQEAKEYIEIENTISFNQFNKLIAVDENLKPGYLFTSKELLATSQFIHLSIQMKESLESNKSINPKLFKISRNINHLEDLFKSINSIINHNAEIKNNASSKLSSLRKKSLTSYKKITSFLEKYTLNKSLENYLQSGVIKAVSGRLAVEVKTEYKNKIKGIIHGTSSSNQTVFIEPYESIDICNEWIESSINVKNEEDKILRDLSRLVIEHGEIIFRNGEIISDLDLIIAKAKLAKKTNSSMINIEQKNIEFVFNLKEARHPLLGEEAIPINFSMEKKSTTIIISGPNTGGKTVSLKTLGLLAIMNQSGLQVTANAESTLPIFNKFFVHIGDNQDIVNSKSSFSSHISSIIKTLNQSTKNSLILIDEIVSSTDPDEGMAIACAILFHLNKLSCTTLITTHIRGIVEYGLRSEWCENYGVSFNEKKNIPTYELKKGVPSSSFAINISKSLGMPEEIIINAQTFLNKDYLTYKKLISLTEIEREKINQELNKLKKIKKEFEEEKKILNKKIIKVEKSKKIIILESISKQKIEIDNLRRKLSKIKDTSNSPKKIKDSKILLRKLKEQVNNKIDTKSQHLDFKEGDLVQLEGLESIAEIIKLDKKNTATFRIGTNTVKMSTDRIIGIIKQEKSKNPLISYKLDSKVVEKELDIRGFFVSEVKDVLEKHIDSLLVNSQRQFIIFHGEGSGSLKKEVFKILDESKLIDIFYAHESRRGVTVVDLK